MEQTKIMYPKSKIYFLFFFIFTSIAGLMDQHTSVSQYGLMSVMCMARH